MPEHTIDMTLLLAESIDPERLVAEIAPAVPGALTFKHGHQGPHAWAAWMQITIADDAGFAAFDQKAVWKAIQERFPGTAIDFSCWEWRVGFHIDEQGHASLEDRDPREAEPRSAGFRSFEALEEILPPEVSASEQRRGSLPRASTNGQEADA